MVISTHGNDAWAPNPDFQSTPVVVRLINAFDQPYNNAVATARTCYSSSVVGPDDVARNATARQRRDRIAQSTYAAGHHTTLQHATFQFVLDNVSRQLIWSFLHAHPFYNSEQVSQRYVSVKPDRMLIPALPPRANALYRDTLNAQMSSYQELSQLLVEPAGRAYFDIFAGRRKHAEAYRSAIKKKSQEVARYVLPVATFAHLYHTVSGLTLHRYHRLCAMLDVPAEAKRVVSAMVAAVQQHDPLFFQNIEDTLPLEATHEYALLCALQRKEIAPTSAREFCRSFDAELGDRISLLCDYKVNAEATLARSVRSALGIGKEQLSNADAIAWVLSPAKNPYLSGALNLTSLGKLSRSLFHPHYTFQKKLSHSADSQDQRHRMVPGTRPVLHTHYAGIEPDVVVPTLIKQTPAALDRFMATMQQTWQAIDQLLDQGIGAEQALYLLPNAFPIRFEESGDLASLHHKWTTRLCYNAQEEIWQASLDEVSQVSALHPNIGRFLLPPCGLRKIAGARPLCPEGDRYCGVPVWKLELADYRRVI